MEHLTTANINSCNANGYGMLSCRFDVGVSRFDLFANLENVEVGAGNTGYNSTGQRIRYGGSNYQVFPGVFNHTKTFSPAVIENIVPSNNNELNGVIVRDSSNNVVLKPN